MSNNDDDNSPCLPHHDNHHNIKILSKASLVDDDDHDLILTKIAKSNTTNTTTTTSQHLFNDTDRQTLKRELSQMIDTTIEDGIADLGRLRDKYQNDLLNDGSLHHLEQLMTLNAIRESSKFDIKVDSIVGTFLNQTSVERHLTHTLANEDLERRRLKEEKKKNQSLNKDKLNSNGPQQTWKKTNDAWDAWDDW